VKHLVLCKPSTTVVRLTLLLLVSASLCGAQTLEVGSQLPELRGETLLGAALVLPDAAKGKIAFLTITFNRQAGKSARAWNQRFEKDHGSRSSVTNYSVAMLEEVPRIFRGMVKSGIKKGVPQQLWNHFLIVTSDEVAWKKYLNVTDDDLPYVLLIDGSGSVIWKDQGVLDEKKYELLKARVEGTLKE
jgi:ATP10 protein